MIRALFGGSFDPFHEGHLEVIRTLLTRALCDHVHAVPAFLSPFKTSTGASAEHRLAMVQVALADEDAVTVEDLEVKRGGPSWAVETLAELQSRHQDDQWLLVLGADSVSGFDAWRAAGEILASSRPVVFARADFEIQGLIAGANPVVISDFEVQVSSTQLRSRLLAGERDQLRLPATVLAYIIRHDLYRPSQSSPAGG